MCHCCSSKLTSVLNVIMKRTCPSCQRVVCPACLVFTLKIPRMLCVCKRCDRLSTVDFEPRHLMRLRGKELRDILVALNIPYTDGSEKSELVELIVRRRGASAVHRGWRPSHPPEPPATATRSLHGSMDDLISLPPLRETSSTEELTTLAPPLEPPSSSPSNDEDSNPAADIDTNSSGKSEAAVAASSTGTLTTDVKDIESESEIRSLSIRHLKSILLKNSVDYKGCCEKWELEGRVLELWRSIRATNTVDIEAMAEEDLCKICMNAPMDCVMLECGHVATCTNCGRKMNECPICRQFVVRVVHIFKA